MSICVRAQAGQPKAQEQSMGELRFDGKVAVVTGAGAGLGKSHALLLASRGAKVVVNDLGGTATGGGRSTAAADEVVSAIKAAGGSAVANHDSVEDGAKIIKTAVDTFGRVDILINNAGILRDTSFQKMTQEDWDLVYRVHVLGAFRTTHAAWNLMRDQGYGRIVFTTSSAGLYGNFGQANYAMAKLGLVGLANTLAVEGIKRNVLVNTVAPVAGSRLTETVMPKEIVDALRPGYVSPLVAWLCHETCEDTGTVYEVGGGFMGRLRWERSAGKMFGVGRDITPEQVRASWKDISGFEKSTHPANINEALAPVLENLERKSKGGNEFINVDEALGFTMDGLESSYDARDVSLYALGVGAGHNAKLPHELQYTYENHGDGFWVLPTYAVVPAVNMIMKNAMEGKGAPGLNYGLDRILHGEQSTEVFAPLPPKATLVHKIKISDIFDKGKNAVVVTTIESRDKESGALLCRNELTAVVRGAGGWGGDRGPTGESNVPPERAADVVVTEKTDAAQGLLYRLSGDINPLHVDPGFASAFGFDKPILHGLCTYGYVARHVINSFCKGDPRTFKAIKVRFAESVFPGETIKTEMWKVSDTRIILRATVVEREKVIISNAAVDLYQQIPTLKVAAPVASKPAAASEAPKGPSSAEVFGAIRAYVEQNPNLVTQVGTVYRFSLKKPDSAWTVDLKNGKGSVTAGSEGKADCNLELTDADFMAMVAGQEKAQKLFTSGRLKISGNVMASQKLEFLTKLDKSAMKAPAGAAAPPASSPSPVVAEAAVDPAGPRVFAALQARMAKTPDLVHEVKACVQFKVTGPDGAWGCDFRKVPGVVTTGMVSGADTTLTLADEDLLALCSGKTTVKDLFQHGKLRVDGDVGPAHRLGFLNKLL
jgi:3-hydroxyacyl-CoA dehydrogenase/3a,7a,12a-trihydroxy-5b-cholest-24-enoyl-CoA hydratase